MTQNLIQALNDYYRNHAPVTKNAVSDYLTDRLALDKVDRKIYRNPHPEYAVRFCYAGGATFSNTVLSLKALLKFDDLPFIICLIRSHDYALMLANTTFLSKISHSSLTLRTDNIVGSFLGHDILREYQGLPNTPDHFAALYAIHCRQDVRDNIGRLVAATQNIAATKQKTVLDERSMMGIRQSIDVLCGDRYPYYYETIRTALDSIVAKNKAAILAYAGQEPSNVNLRGNKIEQIITSSINEHKLEDYAWTFPDGVTALIDIKTHLAELSSNPKHQNIDKFLQCLAQGNILSFIYFVVIEPERAVVKTCLINNLEKGLINELRLQHHWSGRNTRGTTQIDAAVHAQIQGSWPHIIDRQAALDFIAQLAQR